MNEIYGFAFGPVSPKLGPYKSWLQMQKHFSAFPRGIFQEGERTKCATDYEDKCSSQ